MGLWNWPRVGCMPDARWLSLGHYINLGVLINLNKSKLVFNQKYDPILSSQSWSLLWNQLKFVQICLVGCMPDAWWLSLGHYINLGILINLNKSKLVFNQKYDPILSSQSWSLLWNKLKFVQICLIYWKMNKKDWK